jgi:ABC-type transporter Mla MlaB component
MSSGSARSQSLRVNDLEISGPSAPADVAALCSRARVQLECGDAEVLVVDVGGLTNPDVGTVDALARLQLTARRLGCRLQLRRASRELRGVLVLCGLSDVLGVEPRRQAEEREQAGRVEERVERGDPPV